MVNEEPSKWDIPSIGLGIIKDGEIVLSEGFGCRNYEEKIPADNETMYQISSFSVGIVMNPAAEDEVFTKKGE